jgi:DNA (cytosine-5)-methyltransferase 1
MVEGDSMRILSASEALAAMSFPADTRRPDNHRLTMHMAGMLCRHWPGSALSKLY